MQSVLDGAQLEKLEDFYGAVYTAGVVVVNSPVATAPSTGPMGDSASIAGSEIDQENPARANERWCYAD